MKLFWENFAFVYTLLFFAIIIWRGNLIRIMRDINPFEFFFKIYAIFEFNQTLLIETEIANNEYDEIHTNRLNRYRILTKIYWYMIYIAFVIFAVFLFKKLL